MSHHAVACIEILYVDKLTFASTLIILIKENCCRIIAKDLDRSHYKIDSLVTFNKISQP
jgi:hypothetical protein